MEIDNLGLPPTRASSGVRFSIVEDERLRCEWLGEKHLDYVLAQTILQPAPLTHEVVGDLDVR